VLRLSAGDRQRCCGDDVSAVALPLMDRIVVESGGTDWLTPVATLFAVLVGGVISWLVQSRLAERRADFEREAQVEAAKELLNTEARAAARVLQSDLSVAASRLTSILEDGRWLGFDRLAPPSWGLVQASLGKRLPSDAWECVAEAAIGLRTADDFMRAMIAEDGLHPGASSVPIEPKTRERLESIRQVTTNAYGLLSDVAETRRVADDPQTPERSARRAAS
jgi:hypothetical protein